MLVLPLQDSLAGDIEFLTGVTSDFKAGKISQTEFKARRVPMGVYEQRKDGVYMARIRTTGGVVSAESFRKVLELAEKHGSNMVHITIRQEIQIHNLNVDQFIPLLEDLKSAGLSTKGGGGNTVRNILVSEFSGIGRGEVFDATPDAFAAGAALINDPRSYEMPRKLKLAFSSDGKTGFAGIDDLGFVAEIRDGKKGFKVYAGGGMGSRSRVASVLYDFVPEEQVPAIAVGVRNFFNDYGNRRNRGEARLRYVYYKLGEDETQRLIREYVSRELGKDFPKAESFIDQNLRPDLPSYAGIEVPAEKAEAFSKWRSRYVLPQKQDGYFTVYVPVEHGNIFLKDTESLQGFRSLIDFTEKFGADTLRFAPQAIRLRNLPERALPELYLLLDSFLPAVNEPVFITSIASCTGADTCRLGFCFSKGLATAIRKRLLESGLDLDRLAGAELRISGCPNCCGQHLYADLGFQGRVLRNDRPYPGYRIYIGAEKDGTPEFGREAGILAARDVPAFVEELVRLYLRGSGSETFSEFLKRVRLSGEAEALAGRYSEVPSFEVDKNYYFDWGADQIYVRENLGKAECSSGLFDMLKLDYDHIRDALKEAGSSAPSAEKSKALGEALFSSSRLLLVTRGLDPRTHDDAYTFFISGFIDSGIVGGKFRKLVEDARDAKDFDPLAHEEEIRELADTVVHLYKNLDDSLQFKAGTCEVSAAAEAEEKKEEQQRTLDLRGVPTPVNFVRTKLALAKLKKGDHLELLLDDSQPARDTLNAVEGEGHKILSKTAQPEGGFTVIVEKA